MSCFILVGGITNYTMSVLPFEHIHHVKDVSSCNYCHQHRELEMKAMTGELTEEEQHFQRWWEDVHHPLDVAQHAAYHKDYEDVRYGRNNRHIVVTHDFSKIKTQQHQHQDYILVSVERAPGDQLVEKVYHYVAESPRESHDVRFVEYVWRELLDGTYLMQLVMTRDH